MTKTSPRPPPPDATPSLSFDKKKDAVNFAATARVEVRAGTHTADSQSITIAKAGELWIATGEKNRLERSTVDAYRQHLDLHIAPYLGSTKLSQLSAPMAWDTVSRGGADQRPRSPAMIKKVVGISSKIQTDARSPFDRRGGVGIAV
jgi:integrase